MARPFEFRFVDGAISLKPHAQGELRPAQALVWLNHKPSRKLDFVGLATLSDVFFIRIIQVRGHTGPMGTVTLTTYFHAGAEELAALGDEPLLGEANSNLFASSFHDQSCRLWASDGRLLASGTQMVWFKE